MAGIIIGKETKDINEFALSYIKGFPDGFLYSDSLLDFVKGFLVTYQDFYTQYQKAINDLFDMDASNLFLDEFKTMYGLPNALFPEINTDEDAAFAITMMKLSRSLISVEDYTNFLALLGYSVIFYPFNPSMITHTTFPYTFPIYFSGSLGGKDKLTYWVYVEEASGGAYNIGTMFPITFLSSSSNELKVKNILDFIRPDYLKFVYITLETKNLYGL